MIKITDLQKNYGKKKAPLQVLRGITIDLPDTGLIAVCGESGCGKTTLLNCIGGTDSSIGEIIIDGEHIEKISGKTDKFRSKNIGYIFQDYKLIEDKSVKYNLQLAINIARTSSVDDEAHMIKVLDALEMGKYLKRKVNTLSGGQKQRIAIARALINNPYLILADEPTGHLDSENTFKIMDILKSLSKDRLVIWVSHEKELVNAYADNIIELENGNIKKYYQNTKNEKVFSFNIEDEGEFYLEDYNKKTACISNVETELYTDVNSVNRIQLIISKNNVYLSVPEGITANIVAPSKIKEKRSTNSYLCTEHTDFKVDLPAITRTGKLKKIQSFSKLLHIDKKKLITIICFIFSAIFLAVSMSFANFNKKIEDSDFLEFHKNVVQIDISGQFKDSELKEIESIESVKEILHYHSQFSFELRDNNLLQTSVSTNLKLDFISSILNIEYADKIKYGRLPTNSFEILIDEMLANKILNDETNGVHTAYAFGYTNLQNFLNATIETSFGNKLKIVGITEKSAPAIYLTEDMLLTFLLKNVIAVETTIYTDLALIKLTELEDNCVYIDDATYIAYGYDENNNEIKIEDKNYHIAGTYPDENYSGVFMNKTTAEQFYWEKYLAATKTLMLMTNDTNAAINSLARKGFTANSLYEISKLTYEQSVQRSDTVRTVLTIVVILVAAVIYWMTEKSRINERIDEITVRRVIGETKSSVFFSLIVESVLIMLIFAIPVYLITVLLIGSVASTVGTLLSISAVTTLNIILGIIILFAIAVLTTLLSCLVFLNKPAAKLFKIN